MNFFGDYHIHTLFCDGKDSPGSIAERALELGLECIGFSGHACTDFDLRYCMSRQATGEYIKSIRTLQQEYSGRLAILLGTELDYWGGPAREDYDYSMGSVHYLRSGDEYLSIDESPEMFRSIVEGHFGGDYLRCAEEYFRQTEDVIRKTGCDVVGHFDLITKFNEGQVLFSEKGEYLDLAFAAVDSLCAQGALFEINTGAMSRGYRSSPYPGPDILRRIKEKGGRIMLGSDCHSRQALCHGFEQAAELALAAGFKSRWVLTPEGMKEIGLQ